ncbi:LLM class flavin-dependent oxidoreductase [Actinophytocola sp.]|uniref:LLM class flavin-dependent oxidoreductase n=1 Tax=Actinophytocola sp. TaxID=1872138 RepID=UPI002ED1A227
MTPRFHWVLPTGGDSRYLVAGGPGVGSLSARGDRPATLDYLSQITRTAEQLGFTGVVAPLDRWSEDAWLTSAMLAGTTSRLKFLVPVRPGQISPALAARMAATFQRHSGGRLLFQVDTTTDEHGDFLDDNDRLTRADEFLRVLRALWQGEEVTFHGEHIQVERAALSRVPQPVPPVYRNGPVAQHADVHLTGGEPPPTIADRIERIRHTTDHIPRFAIRLHVITRDTSGQAWADARRLLAALEPNPHNGSANRMVTVHGGGASKLEVYPNLWSGVSLVPGGADLALVGNHAEVANRIEEYHAIGIDEFILSGHPHLEEAYWFGEGVLPLLRQRGTWPNPSTSGLATAR